MTRIAKPPTPDIQPDLPGAEGPRPKVPEAIKRLLPEYCEEETKCGTARLKANNLKEKIFQVMLKKSLKSVPLPNGGYLKWQEGKDTCKYEPPKKSELPGEPGEGDETEPGEGGDEE